MKVYLITYSPNIPSLNNSINLTKRVKTFYNWAIFSANTWMIVSDNSAMDIFNYLKTSIRINDKLIIIEVTTNWTVYGFPKQITSWLNNTIKKQ